MALPGPRRVAPYERFAGGQTSAQGEFASPEHFNHGRVEAAFGRRTQNKRSSFRMTFCFVKDG